MAKINTLKEKKKKKKAPKINRQATGLFLFDVLLFYSVLALHTDDHDAS